MEAIFHEKQEGQLCAQHCLNNLIQGPHFTAVDLAKLADQLDQEEAATFAEGGLDSPELLKFSSQPSSNMDDSGFFSVQVISRALKVWGLTMALWNSPDMKEAMENPMAQKAFICNHDSHWLTIRKLGTQWFNLNSLLKKPELISDTYLSLFLTQLQLEGYSIFVIVGKLPPCEADELLTLIPVKPEKATPTVRQQKRTRQPGHSADHYDMELAAAMSASMADSSESNSHQKLTDKRFDIVDEMEKYDLDLAAAISMSMQDHVSQSSEQQSKSELSSTQPDDQPECKQSSSTGGEKSAVTVETVSSENKDDPEVNNTSEITVEEMRQKRLEHLDHS